MSTASRRQESGRPPALKTSPTSCSIGPVGECSPGIHFG